MAGRSISESAPDHGLGPPPRDPPDGRTGRAALISVTVGPRVAAAPDAAYEACARAGARANRTMHSQPGPGVGALASRGPPAAGALPGPANEGQPRPGRGPACSVGCEAETICRLRRRGLGRRPGAGSQFLYFFFLTQAARPPSRGRPTADCFASARARAFALAPARGGRGQARAAALRHLNVRPIRSVQPESAPSRGRRLVARVGSESRPAVRPPPWGRTGTN